MSELAVSVRVKPGSSRQRVGGRYPGPHGDALVVEVTARAARGKATDAARRALAGALGVPPSSVTLRTGARSRDKIFSVPAGPAVASRLDELLTYPVWPAV